MPITLNDLTKIIERSLLHPITSEAILKRECEVVLKNDSDTVCKKPHAVPLAVGTIVGSAVKACAVAGFPNGNSPTGNDRDYVSAELKAVNEAVVAEGPILKIIFENDFLQEAHIIQLCEICCRPDIASVKTSTGYHFIKHNNGVYSCKGATEQHLKLRRGHSRTSVQFRAAVGVRTLSELISVRELGVTRIGATPPPPSWMRRRNGSPLARTSPTYFTNC